MEVDKQRMRMVLGGYACFRHNNRGLKRDVVECLVDNISALEWLKLVRHVLLSVAGLGQDDY